TPDGHWINDPNGMVLYKGIYHLFFQYHPHSSIWGPMHWGHATTSDLVHWKREPIAIYPDSIGTIFSGSAVVDKNNTSGFGKNGQTPLVAVFTHHDTVGERSGSATFQNQSIAYSLDEGNTWIKYDHNPVLKNPGVRDFRDPKVMWYEPGKKWIMSLATKNNVTFYSSPDLKSWTKTGEFGEDRGAHGGGWECPDLFPLNDNGKERWVLIANLNPGAPNGGSGTQYFIGDFDGKTFSSDQKETKWIDYGPDDYAGITWANTGLRKIFLGWMSNWQYANQVPTTTFRNAMTITRDLSIKHLGDDMFIVSRPVTEMSAIQNKPVVVKNIHVAKEVDLTKKIGGLTIPCRLNVRFDKVENFELVLSNNLGEELLIGYDKTNNQYFIDRTKSGKTDFQKDFAGKHVAPRLTKSGKINMILIFDVSSVELFADDGLSVMTEIFFPNKPYDKISIRSTDNMEIEKLEFIRLKSIWK
ncbi:MAG: glycoside hydrolase family 32 protein, partial [Ginsengibacter sp.]